MTEDLELWIKNTGISVCIGPAFVSVKTGNEGVIVKNEELGRRWL